MRFPVPQCKARALRPIGLSLAAALLLASCVNFRDIGSSARLQAPVDYASAASLPAAYGDWPQLSWVGQLGGAPLQALVDEALAGNASLQAAAARIAAAQALAEGAAAATRPVVTGSAASTYQRYTENGLIPPPLGGTYHSDNLLRLNLSYDFDFWNKHDAELRSALSQGKAAEAEQHAARLTLTTAIARAWVQLARQHAQLELTERQIAVRQDIDRLTQLRLKAGLDTEVEREQARQQLAVLRIEQAQWQESIALTRNQLAALAGQGPDRGQDIPAPALPADAALALPDALPLGLLGRRPDIVAARWRVEAAQGDIDTARAQFYPNINLAAFAGLSSLGLPNLLAAGSGIVGVGPALQLPVFDGGALRAQLKGRVAGYDAAVAAYNQALTDALHDVADQVQSLRAAEMQRTHQDAATQAAQNGLRLARERERVGTTPMLPVLAAEMGWLTQRKAELDLQARRADARVRLIKALGGGFDAAEHGLAAPAADSPSPNHPALARQAS